MLQLPPPDLGHCRPRWRGLGLTTTGRGGPVSTPAYPVSSSVALRSRFPLAQPSSSRSLLSKAGFPDPLVLSTPLPHRHPPSPLPTATGDGHPPPGHLEAFSTLCLCSGQATLLPAASTHPPAPRDMALMIGCAWSMGCSAGRGYRRTEHSLAAAELFETPRAPTPSVLPLLTLFSPLTAEESMSMFAEVCHPSLTPC
jgi:hypothetical protein